MVTPGTNTDYWLDLLSAQAGMVSGGSSIFGNPVGTIIMYYGTVAPEGYLPCNGSAFSASSYPKLYALLGKATTPDMRGLFVRGYDPQAARDPDGGNRGFASTQNDAMQRIAGEISSTVTSQDCAPFGETHETSVTATGPFGAVYSSFHTCDEDSSVSSMLSGITFDSAKTVRTATETRPQNVNLLYCIKHD